MIRISILCLFVLSPQSILLTSSSSASASTAKSSVSKYNVIFAVNAGGESHTDINGITYARDPLKIGISSDYGKHLQTVGRVPAEDQILYQTERYHHSTFGYEIPANHGDGTYVMVLKFCEVYFNSPNMKVFDVVFNGDHTVISDLDIHEKVGHGVAYDEIVPFQIKNNGKTLEYNGEESDIRGGKIRVEFIKGYRDNPKVNAVLVIKGGVEDLPRLPPLLNPTTSTTTSEQHATKDLKGSPLGSSNQFDENDNFDDDLFSSSTNNNIKSSSSKDKRESGSSSNSRTSHPKSPDPYEEITLSSAILPVFIAIGCFIPALFCICKL